MIFLLNKILLQNSGVRFPLLFERKVKYLNSNFLQRSAIYQTKLKPIMALSDSKIGEYCSRHMIKVTYS